MQSLKFAGLIGLASLGAQAQAVPPYGPPQVLEPVVVTATRSLQPAAGTLRDTLVITREDLDRAGNLSLAEVLARQAGIEVRATGGPGQPAGLFIRGAGSAQTLVLIDGIRVNSAIGSTSVENIPLDMIERIEVVKGPLSSLYGSDAIGGVVQVFTRSKKIPHFHASAAFGEDRDGRVSAGVTGVDALNSFSLSTGYRRVDAPSATNARTFCHDPDRDPYENAFFEAKAAHRMWQGEQISFTSFVTRGKTHFDGCPDAAGNLHDDVNDQTLYGIGVASESEFAPGWKSRLSYNFGRDDTKVTGAYPSTFKTQQEQLTWVNEFAVPGGTMLVGAEDLRQTILSAGDSPFTQDKRDIAAAFASVTQVFSDQRIEASVRRDFDIDGAFGDHTTGSVSYGIAWAGMGLLSATYGEGFRAPTFFDVYGPTSDFYTPNPLLRPEKSRSSEIALRSLPGAATAWRITYFDNRIDDLITYVFPTVLNVKSAHIKGVESNVRTSWLGLDWKAALTVQRPEDDETGKRLQGRAERFGTLEVTKRFGPSWTAGLAYFASGDRFDSTNEAPETRLGGYGIVDARVRYAIDKRWSVELSATNLLDRKYETAVGYDAPRRSVLLSVRFDAF
ncbi:hypothetical protein BWI17_08210 [Betaproteobacteria bacterium GR16-43]|nr:hypothetical protein BWI17_08210 [Betaproteobacteria bacterium GR16-43]